MFQLKACITVAFDLRTLNQLECGDEMDRKTKKSERELNGGMFDWLPGLAWKASLLALHDHLLVLPITSASRM